MPIAKVDIGAGVQDSIGDLSTRDGISPLLVDAFKNEAGSDIRRPGLKFLLNLGPTAKVDGIYWSKNLQILLAVSEGKVYKINTSTLVATHLTGATLNVGTPVSFIEDGTRIFMANGGRIVYTTGLTTTFIADADAPTETSAVGFTDGYILATSPTKLHWSAAPSATDPDTTLSWPTLNFLTPSSHWDGIKTFRVFWREIFMFGTDSIDAYFLNTTGNFDRLSGAFVNDGIVAKDTLIDLGTAMIYLNMDRRFVILQGRQPKVVSTPYDNQIRSLTKVDDAISQRVDIAGRTFYITTFPTENLTLVFDYTLQAWYQWGAWNTSTAEYDRFLMNSYEYVPDTGKHYAGDSAGNLYELKEGYNKDFSSSIRYLRRTGHIDHGTFSRKRSNRLVLKVARSTFTSDRTDWDAGSTSWDNGDTVWDSESVDVPNPKFQVRWQNDGSENWTNWKEFNLGPEGAHRHIIRINRNGIYRTRQYEFACSDPVEFQLVNPIEEDVEVIL